MESEGKRRSCSPSDVSSCNCFDSSTAPRRWAEISRNIINIFLHFVSFYWPTSLVSSVYSSPNGLLIRRHGERERGLKRRSLLSDRINLWTFWSKGRLLCALLQRRHLQVATWSFLCFPNGQREVAYGVHLILPVSYALHLFFHAHFSSEKAFILRPASRFSGRPVRQVAEAWPFTWRSMWNILMTSHRISLFFFCRDSWVRR